MASSSLISAVLATSAALSALAPATPPVCVRSDASDERFVNCRISSGE